MEEALKQMGITSRSMSRGELYWVKDDIIQYPKERLPLQTERTKHEGRPVIILQTDIDNLDPTYVLVLIAPLSTKTEFQSDKDYKLDKGQGNLPEYCIVQLGHIQPILKRELLTFIGKLDSPQLADIDAIIAANLGLIERPFSNP